MIRSMLLIRIASIVMYLVLQSTATYVINYNKVAGYSEIAPFFILKNDDVTKPIIQENAKVYIKIIKKII